MSIARFLFAAIMVAVSFSIMPAANASGTSRPVKKVLVLVSYHMSNMWTSRMVNSIIENTAGVPAQLDFSVVEFDAMRTRDHATWEGKLKNSIDRLKAGRYDMVVTIGNVALDMIMAHSAELPENLPVVFAAYENYSPELHAKYRNLTGVAQVFDTAATIRAALALFPETETVFILSDSSDASMNFEARMKAELPEFNGVKVSYLNNSKCNIKSLFNEVASMPENSLLLLSPWRGLYENDYQSVGAFGLDLAEASKHPFLVSTDALIGYGALGGFLTRASVHGRETAEIIHQVLEKGSARDVPVRKGSVNPVFDYKEIARNGLKPAALPPGSVLLNRPPSIWDMHHEAIMLIAGLVLFLLAGGAIYAFTVHRTLKRSREFYAALPGRILVADRSEKILYFNADAAAAAEDRPECVRDLRDIDYDKVSDMLKEVFRTGERHSFEYENRAVRRAVTLAPLPRHLFRCEAVVLFAYDNTELQEARNQAEEYASKLKRTSLMLDTLINAMPLNIFAKNPDDGFRYVFCNRTFAGFAGLTEKDILERNDGEIFGESGNAFFGGGDPAGEDCGDSDVTLSMRNASGEIRHMRSITRLVVNEDGSRLLLGAALDITELENIRAEQGDTLAIFRTLLDNMPSMVVVKDVGDDMSYVMCNRFFSDMLRASPEDVLGRRDEDFFPKREELEDIRRYDKESVELDRSMDHTVSVTDAGGRKRLCHAHWIPLRLSGGRHWIMVVVDDLSELNAAKRRIEESAERYELTLRSIGDGVLTTDRDGCITMLNPVAERMMGCRQSEALGKPHTDFFRIVSYLDDWPASSPLTRALRTGEVVELANHTDLLSRDGRRYHIADSAAPIRDYDGNIIGAILVFRDVTEDYAQRDRLRGAVTSLEFATELTRSASFCADPDTRQITGSKLLPELWPVDSSGATVPMEEWVLPDDWEKYSGARKALYDGVAEKMDVEYRSFKSGEMRYYRLCATLDGANPRERKFIGVIQDITDIRNSSFALKETLELWDLVINSVSVLFFVKDAADDFRYLICNKAFAEFVGRPREEIVGSNDAELFSRPGDVDAFRKRDTDVMDSDSEVEFDEAAVDGSGFLRHFRTLKRPFVGADGRRLLIGTCTDVSGIDSMVKSEKMVNAALSQIVLGKDFEENLDRIFTTMAESLHCDRITLVECRVQDDYFNMIKAWSRKGVPSLAGLGKAAMKELFGFVDKDAHEGRITLMSDAQHSPYAEAMRRYGAHSVIQMPIHIDGKLWAVMVVSRCGDGGVFSELDAKFMSSMSNIVALAQIRERQNQVIRQSDHERQMILNNIRIPVWLHAADGTLLRANTAVSEIAGISLDELTSELNYEIFCETLPPGVPKPVSEVIRTGKQVRCEVKYGERSYIQTTDPVFDASGRLVYIVKSAVDVTELNALIKSQQVLNYCLEALFQEDDMPKAVVSVLKAITGYFGATRSYILHFDIAGMRQGIYSEYVGEGEKRMFDDCIDLPLSLSEPWLPRLLRRESVLLPDLCDPEQMAVLGDWSGHAEDFDMRSLFVASIYLHGELWGDLGVIYEHELCGEFTEAKLHVLEAAAHMIEVMLERLESRDQILQALKRAQDADKAKSFFIASVSHEIRTPLNAVIGFSELLRGGDVTESEQKEYLENISYSGNALLQLINDVLDLSKLESGQMQILPEPTDFAELGNEVMRIFSMRAGEQNIELKTEMGPLPVLELDKLRIRQILFNLIGNAVKFTKHGSVTLWANLNPDGEGRGEFCFGVRDTGIGIAEADKKKLMEPFVQLSRMRGTNSGNNGTGLGLSISRRLAEGMGGSLTLESEPGRGSDFKVCLPGTRFAADAATVSETADPAYQLELSELRILLVDDVEMNLKVLEAMCSGCGVSRILKAESGAEALAILEKENIDLVLTDVWMPDIDGLELVKRIHADSRFSNLPVAAVTADVEVDNNFAEAGFFKIMHKPVTADKLKELFGEISGVSRIS